MSKIKLTKGELKRQRDSLKQFRHYLPTLQLKKQQLQMKILEARREFEEKQEALQKKTAEIDDWKGLLADPELISLKAFQKKEGQDETAGLDVEIVESDLLGATYLKKWIVPEKIKTRIVNIAGANVPFLENVDFVPIDYDFYSTPFWVDKGIEELRALGILIVEQKITRERIAILEHELRITTQRVNLFEKIKIPECLENIRIIRIYLGDQQANAVGISKVAKKKIEGASV